MFGGEQAARINGPGEKVIEMDQSAGRFHLLLLAQVGTTLFRGIGWLKNYRKHWM